MEFPGFTTLKLISEGDILTTPEYFVETTNGMYLSNISFIRKLIEISVNYKQSAHGPCLSDKHETTDTAFCFHLHSWTRQAEQRIYCHRPGQWPTDMLINDIVNYGCILVPIGPKEIDNNELLWRISFSMAEKQLSHSMNYTQILCYALLKLCLKNFIDRNDKVKDLLCSYFMKTLCFGCQKKFPLTHFSYRTYFTVIFFVLIN
jgi:hypothetical protein